VNQKTDVILVRHGVTDWNQARRFQGQIDIPLNESGREQARLTGRRFAESLAERPVHRVLASDLARARDTGAAIAAACGLGLQIEPLWRERHYGAFEGQTHDDLQLTAAEAYQRWRAREPDFALPGGGESLREFNERVRKTLIALVQDFAHQTVVVATHGGVLDCVYRIAAGLDLRAPRHFDLKNASFNHIRWDGKAFSVVNWGDVSHLPEALDDIEAKG
jgi:probable phosphoglycerate mutase